MLWTGPLNSKGYGRIPYGGKHLLNHRLSWEFTYGPIPPGMMVCHRCDTKYPPGDITYRRCWEPTHLFLETSLGNMRDMIAKKRDYHPRDPGVANPAATINDEVVREIRRLLKDGLLGSQISKELKVSPYIVSRIKLGKAWTHVE